MLVSNAQRGQVVRQAKGVSYSGWEPRWARSSKPPRHTGTHTTHTTHGDDAIVHFIDKSFFRVSVIANAPKKKDMV